MAMSTIKYCNECGTLIELWLNEDSDFMQELSKFGWTAEWNEKKIGYYIICNECQNIPLAGGQKR